MNKTIEILRKNTKHIININPSNVTVIRSVPIKDDDGNVIDFKEVKRENVTVRIAISKEIKSEETKAKNLINKKVYNLTTYHNEDIKQDDLLQKGDELFKVLDIENITLGNSTFECCYKKSGSIEKVIIN